MFFSLSQKLMFQLDAERAHEMAISFLKKSANTPLACAYKQQLINKPVNVFGIDFKNPVGLAAGLDKNGECVDAFDAMGFGFVEVGTITPRAQPGNEKPRIFRLKEEQAIINRMGFNNKGVDYLVEQVKNRQSNGILGINIGKNFDTPVEQGKDDYLLCMDKVYQHASYITVNISSPNTPGLRSLQYGEALDDLLGSLKEKQAALAKIHQKHVPVLLKIAPDLTAEEVVQISDSLLRHKMEGVIATNTTLSREGVENSTYGSQAGGLSGRPVAQKSTQVVQLLNDELKGQCPIIGVGGIDSAAQAQQKFDAGASLVQVYTGFIYKGPELIKEIVLSR
ncbi:quinone-dependent dihydroorotate dehydrogenase [Psychrobium sp. 1_MG-2023]|uniref:quinone-dependent dihydroorotate dehydrogenase n=1 Tax=Psychrobium sp. 1_MG-2023 TaxID=3062624 RepID=UPI000C3334A3|nr:quinone-dependent dihydroorotate dehydrogenase [Psychrobium sp. 1_MG-2023]MDP2560367.1 quinone-dependent dihydroorotate dehydrogenase [Psychrobium sp. 1_MG-2023]PKF55477.1 dihydroorotate dehydrogenase (quinone) [Alteromonadales bacterium alter-6D02]